MTLGERIHEQRTAQKLSRAALARASGVSESAIKQYENGTRQPQAEQVRKIASALGISTDYLYYGSEIDREYEDLCDILASAGITLEAAGFGRGNGPNSDYYYVWPSDFEPPENERVKLSYGELLQIVDKACQDADARKAVYLRKRLNAELF